MKTYTLHYTPEAIDDLRDIYSYIAYHLQEKRTAQDQVSRIQAEIKKIKKMPEQCQRVPWEPWHSIGMRFLPVDHYVVYYEIDQDNKVVHIDRVFYGGRDVEGMVRKEEQ